MMPIQADMDVSAVLADAFLRVQRLATGSSEYTGNGIVPRRIVGVVLQVIEDWLITVSYSHSQSDQPRKSGEVENSDLPLIAFLRIGCRNGAAKYIRRPSMRALRSCNIDSVGVLAVAATEASGPC